MSSIRSASSRTNWVICLRSMKPCSMRSRSLPGVATRICTPARRASVWAFCDTPPKITVCLMPACLPYAVKLSPIWIASSRVGVSMSALMPRGPRPDARSSCSNCIMGMANAAVFPVPVWAQPRRSFFSSMMGMARSWIGVGVTYPSDFSALITGAIRRKSSNDMYVVLLCGKPAETVRRLKQRDTIEYRATLHGRRFLSINICTARFLSGTL